MIESCMVCISVCVNNKGEWMTPVFNINHHFRTV